MIYEWGVGEVGCDEWGVGVAGGCRERVGFGATMGWGLGRWSG